MLDMPSASSEQAFEAADVYFNVVLDRAQNAWHLQQRVRRPDHAPFVVAQRMVTVLTSACCMLAQPLASSLLSSAADIAQRQSLPSRQRFNLCHALILAQLEQGRCGNHTSIPHCMCHAKNSPAPATILLPGTGWRRRTLTHWACWKACTSSSPAT